jgi:hypothetical protein
MAAGAPAWRLPSSMRCRLERARAEQAARRGRCRGGLARAAHPLQRRADDRRSVSPEMRRPERLTNPDRPVARLRPLRVTRSSDRSAVAVRGPGAGGCRTCAADARWHRR